ncbi:MAG: hypothetical protein D6717_01590 [Gammaproteobacteria bacterium]|nr:MAG: hypothetical protein D6717_01590 [Gammaproteobacteria bacterium]
MRQGVHSAALASALEVADQVLLFDPGDLDWAPDTALAPLGARAQVYTDLDDLLSSLVQGTRSGDRVLIMSNGGFGGLHDRLLEGLAQKRAAQH